MPGLSCSMRDLLGAACGVVVAACGLLSCGMLTLSRGMHAGSSSPTRDQTRAPCIGSVESYPLDYQGSPFIFEQLIHSWSSEKYKVYAAVSPSQVLVPLSSPTGNPLLLISWVSFRNFCAHMKRNMNTSPYPPTPSNTHTAAFTSKVALKCWVFYWGKIYIT